MKTRVLSFLFAAILLSGAFVFAANDPQDPQKAAEALKKARIQIAQDAAFIRQVQNDLKLTPDQKKEKIAEFLRMQNEKTE